MGFYRDMKIQDFLNTPLEYKKTFIRLDLRDNSLNLLTPKKWQAFLKGLAQCPNLTTLHLSGNNLGSLTPEQWRTLFEGLAQCPHLTTLDLSGNDLGSLTPDQWRTLLEGLAQCPHVTTLDLSWNYLASFTVDALQSTLALNYIETLILGAHDVSLMSKNQLNAIIELFPQASKISLISLPYFGMSCGSNNSNYLHDRIIERTVFKACVLYQLEKKGFQKKSDPTRNEITNEHPNIRLNQEILRHIVSYLPNNESIIKGLNGLWDKDKALQREMNIFMAQRAKRNPLLSLFFNRPSPPAYYEASMENLQASLDSQKQAGEDISVVCSQIIAAFGAKKNRNPIEQAFLAFFQKNIIPESSTKMPPI